MKDNNSFVVGDVGGTGGKWALVAPDGSVARFATDGYNPMSQSRDRLDASLARLRSKFNNTEYCYYYGAGMVDDSQRTSMQLQLMKLCDVRTVHVFSDTLGAARATCGDEAGIVCILGTGSNAAVYDGKQVTGGSVALGYPLGDEGGGWRIGSELLKAFYYKQMPSDVDAAFRDLVPDSRSELLSYLRTSAMPNRYLASFATFAKEHIHDKWVTACVVNCLCKFVMTHLVPLKPTSPVNFVGGVACNFREQLSEVCDLHGIDIGEVLADPLDKLINYHLHNE